MDEESQVRGCYNFDLYTSQQGNTSVLEKTPANKTFNMKVNVKSKQQQLSK